MRFPLSAQKIEEMLLHSIENGVNFFDTAWIYPGSEEILGSVLHKHNLREKVFIMTKLPLIKFDNTNSSIDFDKYLNQSLERLKTNYVDYYLLHMLADMEHWNRLKNWGIIEWLAEKKKSGQIRQIGFSFHGSGSEFLKILEVYDWEMTMIQYNYFDENFQAGVKGLRAAAEKMPVVIMEPLLGGKLAKGLPKEAVKIFKDHDAGISPAGWALNWLWDQNEVTSVFSGMSAMDQLEENIKYAKASAVGMLGETQKAAYKSALESINRTNKNRCTGCNYCLPCPFGVNIPGSFSSYNMVYSMGYIEGIKQYITSSGFTQVKSASPRLCTKCGICEPKCPQNIPIMKELDIVKKKMEPWFVRFIGFCVRAYFRKKRQK